VTNAQAKRPVIAARLVCSAERQDAAKTLGTAAAAAALAFTFGFTSVDAAYADVSGLTPCADSKAFAKRKKNEVKALQKRLKQYEAGSAPAIALQATIEKTEKRFDNYARQGLLCGTDGLPHLIADPGLALRYGHAGDVLLPTIAFLYVAGWIGYSGTKYVQEIKKAAKPVEKEIIIDVPLAWSLLWAGLGWPVAAVAELRNGTLLEDDSNITVSPR
jgi:photosystem I subunit 3